MIWLVGKNGMLAADLAQSFTREGLQYSGTDVEVDISDIEQVKKFIEAKKFSHIVNCAAYTAVDKAEDDAQKAMEINVFGAANLAFAATALNAVLIHVSTDYVFDGETDAPLRETDALGPASVYGRTKLFGEYAIELSALSKYFIVRTAWLYGKNGKNFVNTMIDLMNAKESVGVVADQWGSPTWTRDLADFITRIVKSESADFGKYHFSGEGRTNWYEFAKKIYEYGREAGAITKECAINALSTEQYPTKAKRPKFSYLSKEKAIKNFGISVPKWEESLRSFLQSSFNLP